MVVDWSWSVQFGVQPSVWPILADGRIHLFTLIGKTKHFGLLWYWRWGGKNVWILSIALSSCVLNQEHIPRSITASYSSKIDILLSKKGLINWYMVYDHKMWHLTAFKFQIVSVREMKWGFYRISEIMLPTLIQRYDKKIISCLIQFKNERLNEILQAVRCHILWSYWYYISIYLDKSF